MTTIGPKKNTEITYNLEVSSHEVIPDQARNRHRSKNLHIVLAQPLTAGNFFVHYNWLQTDSKVSHLILEILSIHSWNPMASNNQDTSKSIFGGLEQWIMYTSRTSTNGKTILSRLRLRCTKSINGSHSGGVWRESKPRKR